MFLPRVSTVASGAAGGDWQSAGSKVRRSNLTQGSAGWNDGSTLACKYPPVIAKLRLEKYCIQALKVALPLVPRLDCRVAVIPKPEDDLDGFWSCPLVRLTSEKLVIGDCQAEKPPGSQVEEWQYDRDATSSGVPRTIQASSQISYLEPFYK